MQGSLKKASKNTYTLSGLFNSLLGQPQNTNVALIIGAHIFFAFLLLLSICFYKERCLGDSCWRVFCLINRQNFCPSNNRWILALVQILPLIGVQLHLQLKTILQLFSVGDTLVFYFLFLVTFFWLKDRYSALSIIIAYVLALSDVYFLFSDLEKHLQLPFIIAAASLQRSTKFHTIPGFLVYVFFLLIIFFGHPVGIIGFLLLFTWQFNWRDKTVWASVLFILFIAFTRFSTFDQYEQIRVNDLSSFSNLIASHSIRELGYGFIQLLQNNLMLWLLVLLSFLGVFYNRQCFKSFTFIVFIGAYTLLVLYIPPLPQREPYLLPLIPFVLYVFFSGAIFVNSNTKTVAIALFFCFLLIINESIAIITSSNESFEKVQLIDRLTAYSANQKGHRFLAQQENIFQFGPQLNTGYYFAQTLLFSAIKGPAYAKAIVPDEVLRNALPPLKRYIPRERLDVYLKIDSQHFSATNACQCADEFFKEEYMGDGFKMWFADSLNQAYFMHSPEKFQWLSEEKINQNIIAKIQTRWADLPSKLCRQKAKAVSIKVCNQSSEKIYSTKANKVEIGYNWEVIGGKQASRIKTTLLEVDVLKIYEQPIRINKYPPPGIYRLNTYLLKDGKVRDKDIGPMFEIY